MSSMGVIPGEVTMKASGYLLHIGAETDTPVSVHEDTLRTVLSRAGVNEAELPSAIGDEARLTRIFDEVASDGLFSRIMNMPGEKSRKGKKRTLSSFQRILGKIDPEPVVRMTGQVKPDGTLVLDVLDANLTALADTIRARYASTEGLISPTDFRGWLATYAKLVWASTPYARGTPFLPPWCEGDATAMREVAATQLAVTIRLTGLVKSDDVIQNVVDGLVSEVATMHSEIELRLKQKTSPGARWTAARTSELDAMVEKLATYERLLGQNMDVLRGEVKLVRRTIGMAEVLGGMTDDADAEVGAA